AEGIAMDDVFANGAIGQAIDAMVHEVKHDGTLAVLNGMNVVARRAIEAVPAAVIAADQAGRIYGSRDALMARLDGELVVRQKVGLRRVTDLHEPTMIEFLFEGSGNSVADNVVFPIRVALVRRRVLVIRAPIWSIVRWTSVEAVA